VNPEWTAPQLPDGSFASPPPPPGNPLSGVLGETWQEYRRHASRLLPYATAGIVVAILATELAGVVLSTLIYYRLTAAEAAAGPSSA
jgi:hypothetical protein